MINLLPLVVLKGIIKDLYHHNQEMQDLNYFNKKSKFKEIQIKK